MSSSDPAYADRRLAILQELAEIGLCLAYRLGAEREPTGETALAFQRVSKTIRQTLALEAQMAGDLEVKVRAATERQAKDQQEAAVRARRETESAYEDATLEAVERLIEAEPVERREALSEAFNEWYYDDLDRDDFDPDRPIAEMVAQICKDLGLEPDWAGLAGEDWAEPLLPGRPRAWVAERATPVSGPDLARPRPAAPDS